MEEFLGFYLFSSWLLFGWKFRGVGLVGTRLWIEEGKWQFGAGGGRRHRGCKAINRRRVKRILLTKTQ